MVPHHICEKRVTSEVLKKVLAHCLFDGQHVRDTAVQLAVGVYPVVALGVEDGDECGLLCLGQTVDTAPDL